VRPMTRRALDTLQRNTFEYFLKETNPTNGLVPDNTRRDAPSSIAAVGLALACYPVGAERGFITRTEAIRRTLTTLRFFRDCRQSDERTATGYKGFYYHFLDMRTGQRTWNSEVSTIDTTYLLAGALLAAIYFDRDTNNEREIRTTAATLYHRADWRWAQNGALTVSHGWKPERGFLRYRWEGYNEALLLYVLGLGSPTHPLPNESYEAWTASYRWKKLYGIEFLYGGPLFVHQLSHVWIDFRAIQDDFMRNRGLDYFENSRRATYVQRQYAIRNPKAFRGYNENCWGITASDGPGPATRKVDGVERRFYDYRARSVPFLGRTTAPSRRGRRSLRCRSRPRSCYPHSNTSTRRIPRLRVNTDSSAASIRLSPSGRPAPAVGLPQATMDSIRGLWC